MEALTKKEIDCNKLILENDSLIEKYKNTYNKTIEYISKNGFRVLPTDSEWSDEEKQRANENEVERYISIVQEEFYTQIIKSIIILDKQLYTVFEKPIITKQLQELSDIFFVDLEAETDTDWHIIAKQNIQAQKEGFYNNGITYPKAENFTKDYVLSIIQTLLPNKKSNSEKDEKKRPADVTKKTFIDIGIVLASEEFNEMKKSKKDDTEITKHFFPHLTEETYPTLGTVRIYLNGSYNVGCGRFWNHGSRNTEVFDAIENHYKNNNKEIDPKFKEGMTKIRQKQ